MNRPANVALALLLLCVSGTTGAAVKRRGLGPAQPCSPDVCKLPDCRCSGTDIPGNLQRVKVPQMIMLSFDDAVNGQVSFSLHTRHWLLRFYPWQICQSLLSFRLSNSAEGKKMKERKHFCVDSLWKFVIGYLFCLYSKRLLSTICLPGCMSLDLHHEHWWVYWHRRANSFLDILTCNWDVITFQIPFSLIMLHNLLRGQDFVSSSWVRSFFSRVFPVRYGLALLERKGEIGAKGALGGNNATPVIRWHHRKPKRNIRKNCLNAEVHATRLIITDWFLLPNL